MNVNPKLEENMKTRFLLLFTLLLIANIGLFAQTPDWVWATGGNCDSVDAIKIDNVGNTYVTGYFYETATFGSYSLTNSNLDDDNIFVAKMDCDGNWQWASQAGGTGQDRGYGISIDDTENIYVTGKFNETAHFGSYSLTSNGYSDMFIAKIDADGDWQWANNAGGSVWDEGRSITIDSAANTCVTGWFEGTASFGSYSLTSCGGLDIFVGKMEPDGNWQWVVKAGGGLYDEGHGINVDANGNSYVTGYFEGAATFGSITLTTGGDDNMFIAKLNSSVSVENEIIPMEIQFSNYPNPFNPTTKIQYSIKERSNIRIDVYNLKGHPVKSLFNGQQDAGDHSVVWNGKDDNANNVSSGIYFYKLNVNGETESVKKCILMK